jgi:hypothetical protein
VVRLTNDASNSPQYISLTGNGVAGSPSPTPTPVAGLDQYGGVTSVSCGSGPQAHFYAQRIGDRWWLCDPAGHGFFMKGVTLVFAGIDNELVTTSQTKYGYTNNPYVASNSQDAADVWIFNWDIEQVNRLHSWGFNELADGAYAQLWPSTTDIRWNTPDYAIPAQFRMPFNLGPIATTASTLGNNNGCGLSSAVKDMLNGLTSGVYYSFADYFDPNWSTCITNLIAAGSSSLNIATGQGGGAPHGDYLVYLTLDEGDQTGQLEMGPDFPVIGDDGVPQSISAAAHPAWVTLTTAPTQSTTAGKFKDWLGGGSYSNHEVYSKVQLANDLVNRYLCTGSGAPVACCSNSRTGSCSVDPAAASYVGPGGLTTATSALNGAWGSNYTTLSTSDPNCTNNLASCLQNGTYSSWGTGSGLLDENGAHSWVNAQTTAMQADMSAFLTHYLDRYFGVMTSAYHTAAPGILLQMILGSFGTPPRKEVLTEASKYLDLPQLSGAPPCPTCTDTQARIDFAARYLGDKPWMTWQGFFANPDSAESGNVVSNNIAATQAARGNAYKQMVASLVNAKDSSTGTYHAVGFYWWGMYDMDNEGLNWGLITPHDNPYDGKSAVIAKGVDQWGYSTGGETANYGDFLDNVTSANNGAISSMAP